MRSSTTRRLAALAVAASSLVAAGTAAPATAAGRGSAQHDHLAIIGQLDQLFASAEAVTAWPKGMCTDVYTRIVDLSGQLARATAGDRKLVQLHDDALVLQRQATALIPECGPFDSGQRVAQMENRYLRVDMQLWQNQLHFDLANPRNHLAPTKVTGPKPTMVANPADADKESLAKYRDCVQDYCPTYVVIPTGSYMMGGTPEEWEAINVQQYRREWESPRHEVTITQRFAVADKEVTQGEFAQFVKETGYKVAPDCVGFPDAPNSQDPNSSMLRKGTSWKYPNFSQSPDQPVVCVSRPDAQAYATWLSKKTGETYRLPSEAEWEYVARAGTTSPYFWGWDINDGCEYAAMYDQLTDETLKYGFTPRAECNDGAVYTNKVGSYKPNPWGLYDVTGNAREWVLDAWEPDYQTGPYTEAPRTGGVAEFPVLRGGAWDYMPQNERIAYRSAYYNNYIRSNMWGFRLVRELDR